MPPPPAWLVVGGGWRPRLGPAYYLPASAGKRNRASVGRRQEEGVFCEPASAAGLAGLLKLAGEGRAPSGTVVSVLTGHGLKDPDVILSRVALPEPVAATFGAVAGRMERSGP